MTRFKAQKQIELDRAEAAWEESKPLQVKLHMIGAVEPAIEDQTLLSKAADKLLSKMLANYGIKSIGHSFATQVHALTGIHG